MERIAIKKRIRWSFKNQKIRSLRKSWIKAQRALKSTNRVAQTRNWDEVRIGKIGNREKANLIRGVQEKNGNEKTKIERTIRIANKDRNRDTRGNRENE
jgi:hypothetical protein